MLNFKHPPHLTWDTSHACWCLTLPRRVENDNYSDTGYCMLINHSHDWEDNNYVFIRMEMGEEIEIVTMRGYNCRLNAIEEHEGSAARTLWHQEQNYVRVENDDHPVFTLRKYFEALMTLNLLSLAVTYGIKNQPSASKELRDKMDEQHRLEMEQV